MQFAKHRDELEKFWYTILWTYETKINLYQSDRKAKLWRKKRTALDFKHLRSSVKGGGGNVITASGTGSLFFLLMIAAAELIQKCTETFCLPIYREMHPNGEKF